jgi:hypothetical protein
MLLTSYLGQSNFGAKVGDNIVLSTFFLPGMFRKFMCLTFIFHVVYILKQVAISPDSYIDETMVRLCPPSSRTFGQ